MGKGTPKAFLVNIKIRNLMLARGIACSSGAGKHLLHGLRTAQNIMRFKELYGKERNVFYAFNVTWMNVEQIAKGTVHPVVLKLEFENLQACRFKFGLCLNVENSIHRNHITKI